MDADGVETFTVSDPERKAMLRPPGAFGPDDPGAILGVFKAGYQGHDYEEWLLGQVATILDDAWRSARPGCCAAEPYGDWSRFLEQIAPVPADEGRGRTIVRRKRDCLTHLWNADPRVAPWKGTAWGALQGVSTHAHHEGTVRGMGRAERNMLRAVKGDAEALDRTAAARFLEIAT